jgi:hypothetical protein
MKVERVPQPPGQVSELADAIAIRGIGASSWSARMGVEVPSLTLPFGS